MPKNPRTIDQTEEELEIQLHLLAKACREFDAGDLHEIRNIARALRVMLTNDDRGDLSLLERAGYGEKSFPDTRILTHPRNLLPEFSLVGIVFGPITIGVRALLDDSGSNGEVSFSIWLEQIISDDKEGNLFSRHRLVKAVANLAGGTHYPSDIRDYFAKIENTEITAEKEGRQASVRLRDVEKHSLRQIAFEVLHAFGKSDGKGVRAEAGAILIRSSSMLLYPGRDLHSHVEMKTKGTVAPFAQAKEHGLDSVSGFMAKLPYEGTGKNAPCPCDSGLRFKNCCATPHQFSAQYIDDFERRHSLGKYDNGVYTEKWT